MKTQKKSSFVGLLVLMLLSASCNENFLEKNPLDTISSESFWNNEAEMNMALTGVYASLRNDFLGWQRPYLECLSDNAFAHWGYFNIPAMTTGNISAATGGAVSKLYNGSYSGIARCNFFMDNVEKATSVNEGRKNIAKGEVRFLRALMYFDLVNAFG